MYTVQDGESQQHSNPPTRSYESLESQTTMSPFQMTDIAIFLLAIILLTPQPLFLSLAAASHSQFAGCGCSASPYLWFYTWSGCNFQSGNTWEILGRIDLEVAARAGALCQVVLLSTHAQHESELLLGIRSMIPSKPSQDRMLNSISTFFSDQNYKVLST